MKPRVLAIGGFLAACLISVHGVQAATNSTTSNTYGDSSKAAQRHVHHHHPGLVRQVSTILGMEPRDVRRALHSGQSLVDVAATKGVSEKALTTKLRENFVQGLTKAQQEGHMSSARAKQLLSLFDAHISQRLNYKGLWHHHSSPKAPADQKNV